ncbi:MAG TPA: LamG-like jellyroll fold domain-containing protein, partial [Candidatus Marinimicrobia bacterium]|nr:LamG-like jellyroll fold domain-containing protein [Candidatus Neomarinimicrobiota bacterium]
MDDLRLYNRALSEAEVVTLYDLEKPESEAPESTYQIVEGSFTWHEAKADAEARGGHLAVITSQEENDFIFAMGATNEWLGGTDEETEGNWRWITGERWNYTNWHTDHGQPDNGGNANDEHHLHFYHGRDWTYIGTWNDIPSNFRTGYVLEIPKVDLESGLVAYYPFNGNANDESGYGNNGEVHGVILAEDRFGDDERAYSFAGTREKSQYIDLGKSSQLNLNEDFSICAWVYQVGGASDPRIISYGQDGGVELLDNGGASDQSNFAMNFGSHRLTAENSFELEKWHFVIGLQIGSTRKLYVNGKLEATDSEKRTGNLWSESMNIGRKSDWVDDWWGGLIDDVRIYNRALSETEVAALHELENPEPVVEPTEPDLTTGLVAYYPFNGSANDESGNGNHGEVNGATLTEDRNGGQSSAYDFDGNNDGISLVNPDAFKLQIFTISAWVKPDINRGAIIVNNPWLKSHGYVCAITDNGLGFTICRGGTQSNFGGIYDTTKFDDKALPLGQWSHVAFSF